MCVLWSVLQLFMFVNFSALQICYNINNLLQIYFNIYKDYLLLKTLLIIINFVKTYIMLFVPMIYQCRCTIIV